MQNYRQSMHALHKNMPQGVLNNSLPNPGPTQPSDLSFSPSGPQGQGQGPQFSTGGGPNNRMGQNKSMARMPPPSPVMNPTAKDQSGSNKDNKGGNPNANGHPEGSPRNQPNTGQGGNNAGQGGTAPPTPAPVPQNNMTTPSPSAILSNPSAMNQPGQSGPEMPSNIFSNDFIQSVASSLDEFDPTVFRPDGDINFERDFGQWFNDDVTIDMK
jgi:hypothetical protein